LADDGIISLFEVEKISSLVIAGGALAGAFYQYRSIGKHNTLIVGNRSGDPAGISTQEMKSGKKDKQYKPVHRAKIRNTKYEV
jgi:hypothetical protein